jgi:hypothetical protein
LDGTKQGKSSKIDNTKIIVERSFLDGNFECNFNTFIRPNQEQLQKMQLQALWQKSNLWSCDSGATL